MACTYLILNRNLSLICNLGAAGAATERYRLGQCLHIHTIIEPDRPGIMTGIPHEHHPGILDSFETAVLATQDRPVITRAERDMVAPAADLIDMEAASIAQACRHFTMPCYVFKFVSDTAGHTRTDSIAENIVSLGESFYAFFQNRVQGPLFKAAGF
ncbi:MAG TPA: hypothetical protein ENN05_00795 [Deltaproteobacteria bacterium]|nr:hypothetical protein [Deltaproteobacteria bacterium]